jgi:hypothetical protein
MDATTITGASFTLAPTAGGANIAATVSYDNATDTATLTPTVPLASLTGYRATLATSIQALGGGGLASAVTWTFTTSAAPPTVTGRTPAAGAVDVNVWPSATATFSRAMDQTTVNATNFTLWRPDGSQVLTVVSYNSATLTATLTPTQNLEYSKTYTAKVSTAVKALDGVAFASDVTWTFTVTGLGTAIHINAGATTAYTATNGDVFSADQYYKSGTTESFPTRTISGTSDPTLYRYDRLGAVTYTIPVPNGTYDVRFHFVELTKTAIGQRKFNLDIVGDTPANPDISNLDIFQSAGGANKALVMTIPGAVVIDGAINIKTIAVTDLPEIAAIEVLPVAPTVAPTAPTAGATGVLRNAAVTATFSRAMDATTISGATVTLTAPGNVPVPATVSFNAGTNVVTLTPSSTLAANTAYTVRVDPSVRATDGMRMTAAATWSFTTGSS